MRVLRRKTRNALNESDVGTDSILQKLCQDLSRPEEFSYMRDVAATADIDNENAVGSYHLWDIIHRHARTACWDSRDRIYSLLSLLKVGSDFEVRYEESRLDMFWRAGTYFNAWELDSQVAGLAETLSLGPLALLHHATVEDKGKIGLLFETAPFRIDAYLPDLPSTSSRFPTQKDKVIEVVQCGKVQQGHRCEISIQTQDDVLLCPCTQDGDPYLDHRRLHAVLSPKTEASGDVIAMSLFLSHRVQRDWISNYGTLRGARCQKSHVGLVSGRSFMQTKSEELPRSGYSSYLDYTPSIACCLSVTSLGQSC